MGTSEHIHEPPKEQGRPAIVKIATVNGGHDIDTKRSGKGLFEFVDTLEGKSRYYERKRCRSNFRY